MDIFEAKNRYQAKHARPKAVKIARLDEPGKFVAFRTMLDYYSWREKKIKEKMQEKESIN